MFLSNTWTMYLPVVFHLWISRLAKGWYAYLGKVKVQVQFWSWLIFFPTMRKHSNSIGWEVKCYSVKLFWYHFPINNGHHLVSLLPDYNSPP